MSVFSYRALTNEHPPSKARSLPTRHAARDLLHGKGYTVEQVTELGNKQTSYWLPFRRRGRYATKRITAMLLGAATDGNAFESQS